MLGIDLGLIVNALEKLGVGWKVIGSWWRFGWVEDGACFYFSFEGCANVRAVFIDGDSLFERVVLVSKGYRAILLL